MRAIEITRPGGPEVLQAAERPMPRPGSGEVLIKVAASGVNRPDVFQRMGRYPRQRACRICRGWRYRVLWSKVTSPATIPSN